MESVSQAVRRPAGRPLSFDRDAALGRAMLLFWRNGYETTSVAELTTAMGITAPSLYTAFGDKRTLFLEAVERYTTGGPVTSAGIVRDAATARDAAAGLLEASAEAFTGEGTPAGCLLASAASTGSMAAADVRAALAAIRLRIEADLQQKIERDIAAGLLPADTNAAALAAMTLAVIQGMSTLARDGGPRQKLQAVARTAMLAWPRCPAKP